MKTATLSCDGSAGAMAAEARGGGRRKRGGGAAGQVTKHIRVRAGSAAGESSAQELAAFTPSFLWLLRDFYLSLEDGGRQVPATWHAAPPV